MYRPVGGGAWREVPGRFFTSPIEFSTDIDPADTQYPGYIQGDCGGENFGVQIPWSTDGSSISPGGDASPSVVLNGIINDSSGHTILDIKVGDGADPDGLLSIIPDDAYPIDDNTDTPGTMPAGWDCQVVDVFVYVSSDSFLVTVKLTDSDGIEHCNTGTFFSSVIGILGVRMCDADGWTIKVSTEPC
jgi:hypothetical protein